MAERRSETSLEPRERRSFPRPPRWLNVLLLVIAVATFGFARHERTVAKAKTAQLLTPSANNPAELIHVRDELASMDVSQAQLSAELNSRLQYLRDLKGAAFYISIDTAKRKLYLRLGNEVVREADIQIGAPATIQASDGRTWTFVPLKGAFSAVGKDDSYSWSEPEWAYAMNRQPIPAQRAGLAGGLGHYVLFLPNNYVIQSPPPADGPLHGQPKPGSFMVAEADMAAIWPRIDSGTRVYIF
jgi:hypothetical protein